MKIELKGMNYKNEAIKIPKILWYNHYIGKFGIEETFTFGFLEKIPKELCKVIISKDNEKNIECFVDSIAAQADKKGFTYTLKVKNKLCELFENNVAPKIYKNFTLEQLLKIYCEEYKIKNTITSNKIGDVKLNEFIVDMGMTAWDVIHLFYEKICNKDIFINNNREITLPYAPQNSNLCFGNYKNDKIFNVKGIRYTRLKSIDDRSNLISKAYVKLVDASDNTKFETLNDENYYTTECGIKRVKYCNVPNQWAILKKLGADYIIKKENKKRYKFIITTFEDVNPHPGMLGRINELNKYEDLCVMEVFKHVDEKGMETKIMFRSNILE